MGKPEALPAMSHELCILYGDELAEYGFDDPHPFGRKPLPAFWKEFLSRRLIGVAVESLPFVRWADFITPDAIAPEGSAYSRQVP